MPTPANIDPSAFFMEGGPTGVLLIHGFTGSAAEMRLVGQYLNERDLTIYSPLLPGHGTTAEDLNNYGWDDWCAEAEGALAEIRGKCETIFVAGLSMGALLSLWLAAMNEDISGIVTYAPAIDLSDQRRCLPNFITKIIHQLSKPDEYWADPEAKSLLWSYDTYPTAAGLELLKAIPRVKDRLNQITCPLLAIYSTSDPTVKVEGVRLVYENVSSTDKQLVEFNESGHVITVDKEWPRAAELTYNFITERVPEKLSKPET
jgi:carboxylesterase